MSGGETARQLADRYGEMLEQGRKRLVEWRAVGGGSSWPAPSTRPEPTPGSDWALARDRMRAWLDELKASLHDDLGAAIVARVNLGVHGRTPLGTDELAEHEARLVELRLVVGELRRGELA